MLTRTAYHEAGHAIVGGLLGMGHKIVRATVEPRPGVLGAVLFDGDTLHQSPLPSVLAMIWAGPLAACRYERGSFAAAELRGSDRDQVRQFCQVDSVRWTVAREQAERLLSDNWPLVQRLARELHVAGTIRGPVINQAIRMFEAASVRNRLSFVLSQESELCR